MTKIAVVMPVLNQFELAKKAAESAEAAAGEIKVFTIDNWTENLGVANAWNRGVKLAISEGYKHILVINDDIVLPKHTPLYMSNLIDEDPTIGVLTATDHRNTHTPEMILDMPGSPQYEIEFLDAPDFACFMLTPQSYEHIGEFDENLFPAYFEDNDYCYRTILSGMQCIRSQNSVFYHYGSRTQNAGPPVVPSPVFEQNRLYFVQKWGGLPGEEGYTTPWNDPGLTWKSNDRP